MSATNNNPAPFFSAPDFTLYHSDCLSVLAALPEESVDLVFADPPYFMGMAAWDQSQGAESDFAFQRAWLAACKRVLKSDGTLVVSGMRRSIAQCALALEELGFSHQSTVVWWKPNLTSTPSRRHFVSNHETLIFAAKAGARPFFNHDIMREWRKNYAQQTRCPSCGAEVRVEITHSVGEQMGSVWAIPSTDRREKKFGYHPTQKPYDLLLRVVFASSREGDTVLDPFCGTGTTGLAAFKNGRKFIGCDFTKDYLDITVRRFEHLRKQLAARREPDFKPAA